MLETNEEYMSQEKLDGLLSKGFEYNASQKELNTKVFNTPIRECIAVKEAESQSGKEASQRREQNDRSRRRHLVLPSCDRCTHYDTYHVDEQQIDVKGENRPAEQQIDDREYDAVECPEIRSTDSRKEQYCTEIEAETGSIQRDPQRDQECKDHHIEDPLTKIVILMHYTEVYKCTKGNDSNITDISQKENDIESTVTDQFEIDEILILMLGNNVA